MRKSAALLLVVLLTGCRSQSSVSGTWYGVLPGSKLELQNDGSFGLSVPSQGLERRQGTYVVKDREVLLSWNGMTTPATLEGNELRLSAPPLKLPFRRQDSFTLEEREKFGGQSPPPSVQVNSTQRRREGTETYSRFVLKAMQAYYAETGQAPPSQSCLDGYSVGNYTASPPPASLNITGCKVTWPAGAKQGQVAVRTADGFDLILP